MLHGCCVEPSQRPAHGRASRPGPAAHLRLSWAGAAAEVLTLVSLDIGLTVVGRLLSLAPRQSLTPGVWVDTWRLWGQHVLPSMGAGAASLAGIYLG